MAAPDNFSPAGPPGPRSLPAVLRAYWAAILVLTAVALLSQLWFHRHGPHYYPYDNLLFQDGSYHLDFTSFYARFRWLHTAKFFTYPHQPLIPIFTYPAPIAVVYQIFYSSFPNSLDGFLAFSSLSYVVAASLFARALRRAGLSLPVALAFAATVLFTAYPAALQLFVANVEVCVWVVVALGIWAQARNRPFLAALCFGLAASMKLFPFVYFGLQLSRRQYRPILLGAAVFLLSTLASLWFVGPSIPFANHGIALGLDWFRTNYVFELNRINSSMDHTLYAMLKLCLIYPRKLDLLPRLATPFLLLEAAIGLLLYAFVIRRLPFINQVVALSVAAVLLPPVSHDYTLLHMYAPFVLLVFWAIDHPPTRTRAPLALAFTCFAILFTPENWLIVHDLRLAGQLKGIALAALFLLVLLARFPSRLDPQPTEPA